MEIEDVRQNHYTSLRKLYNDWSQQPFVDIYVVKSDHCNKKEDVELFYREWKGTRDYCLADVGKMENWSLDRESTICPGSKVEARAAVNMTSINGLIICGRKGGENYLQAARVDPETRSCPGVLRPCSTKTSPENTICTHPTLKETCPITFIAIIEKDNLGLIFPLDELKGSDYEISDFSDTHAVVYSKDTDSLPIT